MPPGRSPRRLRRLTHSQGDQTEAVNANPGSKPVGRLQEVPDAAGEVPFEAADRFAVGLAFDGLAGDVVARLVMAAGAGDRDAVDRGVVLPVPAASEPVAVGLA